MPYFRIHTDAFSQTVEADSPMHAKSKSVPGIVEHLSVKQQPEELAKAESGILAALVQMREAIRPLLPNGLPIPDGELNCILSVMMVSYDHNAVPALLSLFQHAARFAEADDRYDWAAAAIKIQEIEWYHLDDFVISNHREIIESRTLDRPEFLRLCADWFRVPEQHRGTVTEWVTMADDLNPSADFPAAKTPEGRWHILTRRYAEAIRVICWMCGYHIQRH